MISLQEAPEGRGAACFRRRRSAASPLTSSARRVDVEEPSLAASVALRCRRQRGRSLMITRSHRRFTVVAVALALAALALVAPANAVGPRGKPAPQSIL